MTMAGQHVVDVNAITPDMCVAVGMNPRRMEREMAAAIPTIPVTQEDRDKLGRIRQKRLRIVKIGSLLMLVMAIVAIVIGFVSITTGKQYPHNVGGGIIGGVPCIILAWLGLWMVVEGKKTPTGDVTTSRFQCITKCNLCLSFIFSMFIMLGWAFGGVWAFAECVNRKPEDDFDSWSINNCTPNTGSLLTIGLLTMIALGVLFIIYMVTCCSIFCKSRAFGIKSRYELLMDLQQARMVEAQRQQQLQIQQQQQQVQQQQPVGMYGGQPMMYGGQPVYVQQPMPSAPQMHGGQPMYAGQQMQPMLPPNQQYQQGQGFPLQPQGSPRFHPHKGYNATKDSNDDGRPPSYSDVMSK